MRFRYIVTAAALGYIVWMLADHGIWSDAAALEAFRMPARPLLLLGLLAGLPFNIGAEAAKWHVLTARAGGGVEGVEGGKPWSRSLREVLIGTTFALVTPNRTGDAAARVALLPAADRPRGSQAWATGAWAQAGWTVTFGAAAWWAHRLLGWPGGVGMEFHGTVGAALLLAVALWWSVPRLLRARLPERLNRWLESRWGVMRERWSPRQRWGQIGLSGLRYVVFATQFACALGAWGFAIEPALFGAIAAVYLGNMLVPTAALAELGVREALMVAWMQPVGLALPALIAATFAVWLVNLGVPALVGVWLQFYRHD
jgi:hypothetical protein